MSGWIPDRFSRTRATPIGPEETAGELSDRLALLGAELLVETVPRWLAGEITLEPQDEARATLTRLLRKRTAGSTGQQPADDLRVRCVPSIAVARRLHHLGGAHTQGSARAMAIPCAAEAEPPGARLAPGRTTPALAVACGQGALALEVIQLEGKRAMPAADVVRGYPALASATLGS